MILVSITRLFIKPMKGEVVKVVEKTVIVCVSGDGGVVTAKWYIFCLTNIERVSL